ncbi:MAG: hypothetical protein ACRC0G_09525 [Fusobacteriaceae bacterium]
MTFVLLLKYTEHIIQKEDVVELSNVISRADKRRRKKEEEKLAGQMLTIKQLIGRQAYNTMRVLVTVLFPRLFKESGLNYTTSAWLVEQLVRKIPENEELFTALSETVSSDGEENNYSVNISPEKLSVFIEKCQELVTVEYCKEILESYNEQNVKLETAVGAAKIMNERAGEEFEIISDGSIELPVEEVK